MAGDDLATATDHHLVNIASDPDILMPIGDRHGIVVGLVAHERLSRDFRTRLVAGIEWRRRQRTHGSEITLQPLTDRLDLTAQPVALTLAALC
jgi:hypothetical protein